MAERVDESTDVPGTGLVLYDNPFSPFARKVRLVLRHKDLRFRSVDALALDELAALAGVNPRVEVPVLVCGDLVVVESADIVAYLEDLRPAPPVFPRDAAARAKARHWQRIADRVVDAILHDISLWGWPTHRRDDVPPEGLIEAGHRDLGRILDDLEQALGGGAFVCGETPSVADFALFPHMPSLRLVGVEVDPVRRPRVAAWLRRMRALPPVQTDLAEVRAATEGLFASGSRRYEGEKVVWRGDRIEWLLAQGCDAWWASERASGRAVVPASLGAMDRGSDGLPTTP